MVLQTETVSIRSTLTLVDLGLNEYYFDFFPKEELIDSDDQNASSDGDYIVENPIPEI